MTKCFTIKTGKVVCQGSKGAKNNYDDRKVKISNRKGTGRKKPREQRTARAKLTTSELKALLRRNGYTARQLEGKTKVELLKLPPTRRLKDIKDKERTGRAMGVSRSRFKEENPMKLNKSYKLIAPKTITGEAREKYKWWRLTRVSEENYILYAPKDDEIPGVPVGMLRMGRSDRKGRYYGTFNLKTGIFKGISFEWGPRQKRRLSTKKPLTLNLKRKGIGIEGITAPMRKLKKRKSKKRKMKKLKKPK